MRTSAKKLQENGLLDKRRLYCCVSKQIIEPSWSMFFGFIGILSVYIRNRDKIKDAPPRKYIFSIRNNSFYILTATKRCNINICRKSELDKVIIKKQGRKITVTINNWGDNFYINLKNSKKLKQIINIIELEKKTKVSLDF